MLKAALETLAIPPVVFLYVMVVGLALGRRRFGRALIFAGLAGLIAFGMPVVAGSMTVALEQDLPLIPPPNDMPKAIVILGGDVTRAGRLTLDRLRAGAALHRRTGLPIMVSGGIVQLERPSVARIMEESLKADFQVPVEWVEDKSGNTWDNAAFSAAILKKQGIDSVYVVTQAWHMRRAIIAFRKAGVTVTAAPTLLDTPATPILLDFVPMASAWQVSYWALHEWIGCAWYALL